MGGIIVTSESQRAERYRHLHNILSGLENLLAHPFAWRSRVEKNEKIASNVIQGPHFAGWLFY